MKRFIFCLVMVVLLAGIAFGEEESLKILKPKIGPVIDISLAAQERYKQWEILRDKIYGTEELKLEQLTPAQKKLLDEFKDRENFWWTIQSDCGWYEGGSYQGVEASSCLAPQSGNTYEAKKAHDIDLRTAWVEGAEGYGIGEYLAYHFGSLTPPVNKFIVYNGYFKSEKVWEDNARVKRFKLSVNEKPHAILELEDIRAAQTFTVEPLQSKIKGKGLVLKFEIMDVYPGKKWEDVAISEINFDGLGVHCFVKGTMIWMADGRERAIESLHVGDQVMSYDFKGQKIEQARITAITKANHHNLAQLDFGGISVTSTDDHPYFVKGKGWCSLNPFKTRIYKNMEQVKLMVPGDQVYCLDTQNRLTSVVLKNIIYLKQSQETYTIEKLDRNYSFFANKLLVGVEEL